MNYEAMTAIAQRDRPEWDSYFMAQAYIAATRATCHRKHVGCVLVSQDNHVISTGYNGSPPGKPHCGDDNHEISDGHCIRTVHAEANAISQAARKGVSTLGARCYTTIIPCYDCAKLLITAGISHVAFHGFYQSRYDSSDKVTQFLREANIEIRRLHFSMNDVTSLVLEEESTSPQK